MELKERSEKMLVTVAEKHINKKVLMSKKIYKIDPEPEPVRSKLNSVIVVITVKTLQRLVSDRNSNGFTGYRVLTFISKL